MVGIVVAGAYIPRGRLQRSNVAAAHAWFAPGLKALGKGERAIANWDEDSITMAVEASRDCLGDGDRSHIARVVLASSSHPFADRQNGGVVKEALNLSDETATIDVGGSQRAATSALLESLYAANGGAGNILCVASEKRRTQPGSELELISGDAAVAFLIGDGPGAAEFLGGSTTSIDFVDHFRSEGQQFDYNWEARWVRDEGYSKIAPQTIKSALAKCDLSAADVGCFLMGEPMKGISETVARAVGIPQQAIPKSLSPSLGDAGTAQPLVLLAQALETAAPNQVLVVVGFGNGCDVLIFRATGKSAVDGLGVQGWLARRKPEQNYLKYLALNGHLNLARGVRAEFDQKVALTALYRSRKAVFALVGTRCSASGAVQFPRSEISLAKTNGLNGVQEDYPLAHRKAHIITHTADSLTYSPDPPVYYGAIEFEGGGRMTVEYADVEPENMAVGAAMRMMFRIKSVDENRGFIRYFWKAVPDYRSPNAVSNPTTE